ncbi:helix-turn-helix transcriptional regulator [Vibrio sp. HN007]|uniref:helix-turn-helix transcriptional regulator n=1 Tax=Vibrio iocasae TaxID=3098914 RepID=UPI0035D3FE1E
MSKPLPSMFTKGSFTRRIEHDEKQIVVSDRNTQTSALVEGDLISYQVTNGFALHGGVTKELINFEVISTAQKSLIVTILLEGKLDFGYDDLGFTFDAREKPVGVVVNLTKPASFRRKIHRDNKVAKLNIVLPIKWIKERGGLDNNVARFIETHLASFELELASSVLELTREIIHFSSASGLIEKMKLETMTQMLLLEIFKQLSEYTSPPRFEGSTTQINVALAESSSYEASFERSLDELVTYIEANLEMNLTVADLADYSAMSLSSLQRKFKKMLGYSIQSYIRRRRLEIARQQLENGIITVTEAAYSAGYRHPSNFTNAYKKAFGHPPQDAVNNKNEL